MPTVSVSNQEIARDWTVNVDVVLSCQCVAKSDSRWALAASTNPVGLVTS